MNCREFQQLKHAAVDGELDAPHNVDVRAHLDQCTQCARAFDNLKRMKSALADTGLYFNAPPSLAARIRAALPARKTETVTPAAVINWLWLKWTASIGITALFAALVTATLLGTSPTEQLAWDVSASHVRSLMPGHLMDVASTDQHTVKPWFDGKLDFAPPVVDLATNGFPLVGGRLDYLDKRPVAALVYKRNNHFINLFVWPSTPNEAGAEKTFVRNGYNLIHWHQGGMACWAVSDLNQNELADFARRYEDQTAPVAR